MGKQLRQLPDEWYETVLGKISEEVMYGLSVEAIPYDGKHKYIRITDIDEMTRKFYPNPLSSPKDIAEEKYKLKADDIIFARTGASVGKSYLYNEDDGDLYFAGYLIKFHIIGNDAKFIHAQTQTNEYKNWVKSMSMRSGQPGINAEEFKKLPIVIAPIKEQKAIADILQTWDMAIEKTEALIAAKEKRFEWLLRRLMSDRRDDSKWRITTMDNLCEIKKGEQLNKLQLTQTGKYPALNGGVAPSGYTDKWNTAANTITISEGGNSCGYVNYNTQNFWAGGHCYTLINLSSGLDKPFFYYQLKGQERLIMRLRVGSGLPNIQKGDIEKFPVFLPPLPQQEKISHTLSVARREINLLGELAEHYRLQKRGLMQKLLTGQWRLNS